MFEFAELSFVAVGREDLISAQETTTEDPKAISGKREKGEDIPSIRKIQL